MKDERFSTLATLLFITKQIIKRQLPPIDGPVDPNMWLRLETMRFIADTKNPTMQDVAGFLRIKAPSATSMIAHLVRLGFVTREGEKGDKRVVRIVLTPLGTKEVKKYSKRSITMMRKTFSRLDEQEINELVRILTRLQDVHAD
jgi:DNA-binding MarR family transcriptional regulator